MLNEPFVQGLTLGIAVLGAVLGVVSLIRDWRRDTERLKVVPKSGEISLGEASVQATLVIEVVNLSHFPVTVEEVGFLERRSKNRLAILNPISPDRGPWPRRLEPRSAVTLYASAAQDFSWIGNVTSAYARTATGHTFKGTSPRLRWMVKRGEVPTPARRISGQPGIVTHSGEPKYEGR